MACARCDWPYPDGLLSPVIGSAFGSQPVCGICALEIINAVHGTNRKRFQGGHAEEMRTDALDWRRLHPHAKPPEDQP